MYQFIKNLIAAAILFGAMITSVALSYAISPGEPAVNKPVQIEAKLKISKKKTSNHFNDSLNLLIPKV
ncbi:hypothetical protein ACFODZ_09965 [Marinicella sediminis]|uniref:Uncharacterized protein n=1 Tax=Marinicella sediminis TaxID=1792834 RepID=A0ABV7JCY8_9GAMM|nr:hypothetical protein [Marinicella sediminis]